MWIKTILLAGALAASVGGAQTQATPLDIQSITGVWQNSVGGTDVTGEGTSTITWGNADPSLGSAYSFVSGPDIVAAMLSTPLFLGTFTHTNNVIPIPNLSNVDLGLAFNTNGIPGLINAVFPFAHNETPNSCGGCSPGDDDIVTITTPLVNIPILVGTDTFFFNLKGFSKDGGVTFSDAFSSPEGGSNSASLFAQITASPIPEPAGLLLVLTGLAGAALRRRTMRV